jgi:putative oxidoreductase
MTPTRSTPAATTRPIPPAAPSTTSLGASLAAPLTAPLAAPLAAPLTAPLTAPSTTSPAARLWLAGERAIGALQRLRPLALLGARVFVASVFFRSGLTKLRDWDTTLALFADEYHVPLLSPTVAAFLGTGAELVLPVLLVFGLFGRFAAAGLSVVNVVAVLSLSDVPDAALAGHVFWGSLMLGVLLWGPGAISLDRFAVPWLRARVLGVDALGAEGAANAASAANARSASKPADPADPGGPSRVSRAA